MVHDSLDLLKQFIQEWTDIYNDRQTEEVSSYWVIKRQGIDFLADHHPQIYGQL